MKAKFNIGDIVFMKDEFHFNPADAVISVGRIESIHFYRKNGLFKNEKNKGRIVYSITGFSIRTDEKDLKLYRGEEIK